LPAQIGLGALLHADVGHGTDRAESGLPSGGGTPRRRDRARTCSCRRRSGSDTPRATRGSGRGRHFHACAAPRRDRRDGVVLPPRDARSRSRPGRDRTTGPCPRSRRAGRLRCPVVHRVAASPEPRAGSAARSRGAPRPYAVRDACARTFAARLHEVHVAEREGPLVGGVRREDAKRLPSAADHDAERAHRAGDDAPRGRLEAASSTRRSSGATRRAFREQHESHSRSARSAA
jgi:hypothetical protein